MLVHEKVFKNEYIFRNNANLIGSSNQTLPTKNNHVCFDAVTSNTARVSPSEAGDPPEKKKVGWVGYPGNRWDKLIFLKMLTSAR